MLANFSIGYNYARLKEILVLNFDANILYYLTSDLFQSILETIA